MQILSNHISALNLLANSIDSKNYASFWKAVRKQNNGKATKFAQVVDGCTGDDAIVKRWQQHFHQLYNTVDGDLTTKGTVLSRLHNIIQWVTRS